MSYVSSYHHCVFSTKERRPLITPDLQERLWPYLGGIAREHKMTAVEIGGMADRSHALIFTFYHRDCEGPSTDKRRFIQVGA